MLSIGKLAAGQEGYYLSRVAQGIEDYYLSSGEAPGTWLGAAADGLGLSGEVDGDDLTSVLAGMHPSTGEPLLAAASHRRLPGYDVTFSAPKSVSVLFAVAGDRVRQEVVQAHDAAVSAAVSDYYEPHAAIARRGRGGSERMATTGFVAAAFRHRTSRAGDPSLHTHVLVANAVQGEDGRWTAIDGMQLYRHGKAAGYLYKAHLRAELSRRLGLEWTEVRRGIAEVVGVPTAVSRHFSKRRIEIEAAMADRGDTGARAAQVATLATRKTKDYAVDGDSLFSGWREEAGRLGFDRRMAHKTLGRASETTITQRLRGRLAEDLASEHGLTKTASTFDHRDVVMGLADRLPQGADVAAVVRMADAFVRSHDAVVLAEPPSVSDDAGERPERRWSTPEMLATERRLVDGALGRRRDGSGVAAEQTVTEALEQRPSLSDEQVAMVRHLTTSGNGVDVCAAQAGAGKTLALDAARAAWQRSGYRVIGTALAARAADNLGAEAGIAPRDRFTVERLLLDLADPVRGGFAPGSVVVVDEAGMVGTRKLAALLSFAQAGGAKVVLLGDDRQLPEIDAGGAFRALRMRLGAVTLRENRRQYDPDERVALARLRAGDIDRAMHFYRGRDRVTTGDNADVVRERLVDDWWATSRTDVPTLMLASKRSDVEDLNVRARTRMVEAGALTGPVLEVADRSYQAGDRVMALRNAKGLGVTNGTRGTVTSVDLERRALVVETDAGGVVSLPASYLDAGHVSHAYASTVHKAQGLTTEHAFLLGDDRIYRELGYVGMSRGRATNNLYVVAAEPETEDLDLPEPEPVDALEATVKGLRRSQAKELAVNSGGEPAVADLPLSALYAERDRLTQVLAAAPADVRGELRRVQSDLGRARSSLVEAQRVVGTVRNKRTRGQEEPPTAAVRTWTRSVRQLESQRDDLAGRHQRREAFFARHAGDAQRHDQLGGAIGRREQALLTAVEKAPTPYLSTILGPLPGGSRAATAWRTAALTVERYRAQWGVEDPGRALGARPRGPQRESYDMTASALQRAVDTLARERVVEAGRHADRGATPRRSHDRGRGIA